MEAIWLPIVIGIIISLIVYIWNRQTTNHDKLSDRMARVEKDGVSKKELEKLETNLTDGLNSIMKTLNGINDKIVTRDTADLIAENKCNEKIMEHMKSCPFVKNVMNNRNN